MRPPLRLWAPGGRLRSACPTAGAPARRSRLLVPRDRAAAPPAAASPLRHWPCRDAEPLLADDAADPRAGLPWALPPPPQLPPLGRCCLSPLPPQLPPVAARPRLASSRGPSGSHPGCRSAVDETPACLHGCCLSGAELPAETPPGCGGGCPAAQSCRPARCSAERPPSAAPRRPEESPPRRPSSPSPPGPPRWPAGVPSPPANEACVALCWPLPSGSRPAGAAPRCRLWPAETFASPAPAPESLQAMP